MANGIGKCKHRDLYRGSYQLNGTRRWVYGKTKREVKEKLDQLRRQAEGSLPQPGRRTVNDLLDTWLDTATGSLKPRTVADYRQMCGYIRASIGSIKLSRLEPVHIQQFYRTLPGRRVPSRVHAVLHRALALAVLWRWLPVNPADRLLKPGYHPPRREMWTMPQLQIFLDGAREHRMYPLWLTALGTGCRLGELLGLRREDVNLADGIITVTRTLQRIKGEWVTGTPKTRAGERVIALPLAAIDVLRKQEECAKGELVFPFSPAAVEHAMQRECIRLGLPHMTPHALRHLHASLLLAQGVPITAVSARLGHSNVAITGAIYAHTISGQDFQAAAAIGKALMR